MVFYFGAIDGARTEPATLSKAQLLIGAVSSPPERVSEKWTVTGFCIDQYIPPSSCLFFYLIRRFSLIHFEKDYGFDKSLAPIVQK